MSGALAHDPGTERPAGAAPASPDSAAGAGVELLAAERELLLQLIGLPTAGPLEVGPDGPRPKLWEAQRAYAEAAAGLGFTVVHHASAEPAVLDREGVPVTVREAAAAMPDFLECQPSMVLRLGPELPSEQTVMFNVHLDTVAGFEPPRYAQGRFHGRGAIDAKGPAVALLAGLRAALATAPELGTSTGVLIQLVAGEEGGAMGVFGTRPLVEAGYTGRLNIFCEPTQTLLVPRSTASATARITVAGQDSIDDRPGGGHNATVLLGYLAQHLAERLSERVDGGRVCVAGLHTGTLHNKVYGSGHLLLNLAYQTTEAGLALQAALADELAAGLAAFRTRFADLPDFALTAREAAAVTTLDWLKRGLPALSSSDPWAEQLLTEDAGLRYAPADAGVCTCDAIWMHGVPGAYTAVYGPGDLDANGAHAEGEHADLADLESFATGVRSLLTQFARAGAHARTAHAAAPGTEQPGTHPPSGNTSPTALARNGWS
ncbi:M20/M25/M40 family metallo-hydrolase [Streptomyces zagrosensis]|uniref:Acetylornithine deacetylase/succinyl-diaminopimelate desuccinylase-like protein n=1 Tax=Streptomyces zagrosensis TaxID=1042984 RepID=A0A7W9QBA4_9ACTN|nr:M20/M25/M40 family metallo-hydrolase [Streptomyces zagrosensis]MBB5936979.1 acetylornithine deacetylase/succinyl-diaminopimelate desuccinylase-like protein [Streptomyces zagrosensis]